ncbi:electron transport complex subunit E [Herbivorax sp. ANBcel31]|uniref:electron transport complex subunit RsxE n=1 Tax=Herbivorax sp. ANBcel31 TaxID=3069754 RepID=UPI0027B279EE|nr:electron transport complex subunit E [Herbivorax sp. ANBcel31]MDQ2086562.1 electron transport complex subunit E [Herbivorax sp. ANBcel31]
MKAGKILTNGLIKENPVFKMALGACPALAVTVSAINGIGMGLATTAVLIGSNTVISLTKKLIPSRVRIPAYITIIAGFVTIIQFLLKAYLPELDNALGIFIPLIVVNCVVLGRAEAFASKNSLRSSIIDGVGMGLGFTLALFIIGSIRELFGEGKLFGFEITANLFDPATLMILAPGGFLTFGIVIGIINKISASRVEHKGCSACPMPCDLASKEKEVKG